MDSDFSDFSESSAKNKVFWFYNNAELNNVFKNLQMLFEKNSLEAAEATLHGSLQLLSNCVYLVNSTILRERKLLPAEMFREFRVYGEWLSTRQCFG